MHPDVYLVDVKQRPQLTCDQTLALRPFQITNVCCFKLLGYSDLEVSQG